MKIQYKIKYPNLNKDLQFKIDLYNKPSKEQIDKIQLSKLNFTWLYSFNKYSFYSYLKKKYKLPTYIKSIKSLENFPVINKDMIKKHYKNIINESKYKKLSQSGGTSGTFLGFPTNYYDDYYNILRTFYYRKFIHKISDYGCLYIWGHSHKFGYGFRKIKNIFISKTKDFLNNRIRINAYDLSSKNLDYIFIKINKSNINSIIVYGSTLGVLINYFYDNDYIITKKLKVIVTSDNFDKQGQIKFNKVFVNSKLINELGMAETGIIGYSDKKFNEFNIFWDDFLLKSENKNLLITSLNCTCFPLFNYDPEDVLSSNEKQIQILKLNGFIGKQRPFLEFEDKNKKYSTIMIDHILKNNSQIYDFQYLFKKNKLNILYQSKSDISEELQTQISNQLGFQIFNQIDILRVKKIKKTIAGKSKIISYD